ncbi:MAG TPA: hypothetical protein V6D17_01145 [Candidatus Obscuribacterales bacterium]
MLQTYARKQLEIIHALENGAGKKLSTIVPMRDDYVSDERRCLTCVQFVGGDIAGKIIEIGESLRVQDPRQYYYPIESLHMTVQNIRVTSAPRSYSDDNVETAKRVLAVVVPQFHSVNLRVARILELPTSLSVCVFFGEDVAAMIRMLRTYLADAGLPDDKEYVSDDAIIGNITFCRFRTEPNEAFRAYVQRYKQKEIGELQLSRVSLIETGDVCHPSQTKVLASFDLPGRVC